MYTNSDWVSRQARQSHGIDGQQYWVLGQLPCFYLDMLSGQKEDAWMKPGV